MESATALERVEQAIRLLRNQSAEAWLEYLLGAVPFLLAVLAFVRDMASGNRPDRCFIESFVCAAAFLWANVWKSRFAGKLLASMADEEEIANRSGFWRCLYVQAVLQSLKLVVQPFAVISILPLGWVSSFFRNATIEASRKRTSIGNAMRRAASRASLASAENWLGLLILSLAAFIVFVNVLVTLLLLPQLGKTFSGYENEWTRNTGSLLNAAVLGIAGALTWLVVDPVFQAHAVVRYFYAEARSDGRDLLVRIRRLATQTTLAITLVFLMGSAHATGQAARTTVTKADLDRSIQQVLQQDEYRWHTASSAQKRDSSLPGVVLADIKRSFKTVKKWLRPVGRWIRDLLRQNIPRGQDPNSKPARTPALKWQLYAITGLLVACMLIAVLRKIWRSPKNRATAAADTTAPPVSAADDVIASDLPEEEWLRIAHRHEARGEFRLAVRALYLANLSYLGSHHLITPAKSKSNGIYERELRLRSRAQPVQSAFATSNREYERAWYGDHRVTAEMIETFGVHVKAIREHAVS